MPTSVKIECIKKTDLTDPHERIHGIGGIDIHGKQWYLSLSEAISAIENSRLEFWTRGGGKRAEVIIATHNGHKYLKTKADDIQPDNLLALRECP